jgi:hypothetical protein
MTALELLARSFAEQLYQQADDNDVLYLVIVTDGTELGSSSNAPRVFAKDLARQYLDRIAEFEAAGVQEKRHPVPDEGTPQ